MTLDHFSERYLTLRRALIERQFSNMNDRQREAVFATEGPLLILAGAGSGKTTVLINRIANLLLFGSAYSSEDVPFYVEEADLQFLQDVLDGKAQDDARVRRLLAEYPPRPWEIMAITFTNKAANELRDRLTKMLGEEGADVAASTFHSACVRILRANGDRLGYRSNFTIYDADDSQRVMKGVLRDLNMDEKAFPPRSVLALIGQSKDALETPADLETRAQGASDFRLKKIAAAYGEYQRRLKDANAMDFDDIITLTVRLFRENPDVLEKYQHRYRYVMVDEYQDTNRSQFLLVSMLADGYHNLCVVGDDDQSIYRFRGATIENILSFESRFEGARVIRLEQNYRSTQNILDAANHVISNNAGRKGKTLWTDAGAGEKLTVYTAQDERDEAHEITEMIEKSHRAGRAYRDHAVLYRLNAQSQSIESALMLAGIPYKVVGGLRFFDRKEIKDVIAYLSVLNNPTDELRLMRIINEPKRGIGDATVLAAREIGSMLGISLFEVLCTADQYAPLQRKSKPLLEFAGMMKELMDASATAALGDLIDELIAATGYRDALAKEGTTGETRLENIEELKTMTHRYEEETEESSLSGFLEEVALYTDLDSYDEGDDKVTLMTLHAAKGLEFPVVYIPGMEEGMFPSYRSLGDAEQLEEERRLAYVGITRAKEELTLLTAKRRMLFGQTQYGKPSRFLREIPADLVEERTREVAKTEGQPQVPPSYRSRSADIAASRRSSMASGAAARSAQRPQSAAASSGAVPSFAPGDRIRHKVFGEGVIRSVSPMSGDALLEIAFDRVGVKKIMATYARLEKL
jgi:DNA helicase-2/ATP-dependent DNA helicase PcrA